ncbi:MAG: hypothetical protein R3202_03755 [Candidatus Competibacterales bacterium]|nr:hypothetical protein [Candidatus Competibacterales bacterium]
MAEWRGPVLLLALLLSAPLPAQVAIRGFEVETPRDFGYTLGDTFAHTAVLTLNDPWRLRESELPEPERISHWLESRPVRIERRRAGDGIRYRIVLGYQIVNLEPGVERISRPALTLRLGDGQGQLSVTVPPWPLTVAPLIGPEPAATLQPDRLPPPRSWTRTGTILAVTGLGLAGLGLAWLHGPLPLGRRGPFARALPELRRAGHTVAARRAALRRLHAAFDATAGGTLLTADLPRFLERQPRFRPLRADIECFFAASGAVFYAPQPTEPPPLQELVALCRACRDAERGLLR